jgi:hypothetical protein
MEPGLPVHILRPCGSQPLGLMCAQCSQAGEDCLQFEPGRVCLVGRWCQCGPTAMDGLQSARYAHSTSAPKLLSNAQFAVAFAATRALRDVEQASPGSEQADNSQQQYFHLPASSHAVPITGSSYSGAARPPVNAAVDTHSGSSLTQRFAPGTHPHPLSPPPPTTTHFRCKRCETDVHTNAMQLPATPGRAPDPHPVHTLHCCIFGTYMGVSLEHGPPWGRCCAGGVWACMAEARRGTRPPPPPFSVMGPPRHRDGSGQPACSDRFLMLTLLLWHAAAVGVLAGSHPTAIPARVGECYLRKGVEPFPFFGARARTDACSPAPASPAIAVPAFRPRKRVRVG